MVRYLTQSISSLDNRKRGGLRRRQWYCWGAYVLPIDAALWRWRRSTRANAQKSWTGTESAQTEVEHWWHRGARSKRMYKKNLRTYHSVIKLYLCFLALTLSRSSFSFVLTDVYVNNTICMKMVIAVFNGFRFYLSTLTERTYITMLWTYCGFNLSVGSNFQGDMDMWVSVYVL